MKRARMPDESDPQLKERMLTLEERRVVVEENRENRLQVERDRELSLAERQAEPKHWTDAFGNPFLVAAVAGILALAGNGLVAFVNNVGELNLAKQTEQSELVLAALGSDDVDKVKENLRLLAEAKLITSADRRDSILDYLETLEEGQGPGGLVQTTRAAMPNTLGVVNQFVSARRDILYQRALEEGRTPIALVGDGWLNYPLILNDIGDQLSEDYAVLSLANAGNCIEAALARDIEVPPEVEFVLISAGLCELFGDDGVAAVVADPSAGDSPLAGAAERKLGSVEAKLEILIDSLIIDAPDSQIAIHGYDYLPPIQPYHSLGKQLAARGYQGAAATEISRQIIDEFNEIVSALAAERPRVSFIDLRGSLSNQEWYDQLFPTNEGFKKLSDAVKMQILR